MLRLKNIKIGSKYAEADFYPEDSNQHGHIVVSLEDNEIYSSEEVSGYGESYIAHARNRLVQMAKENDARSECIVMWC